MIQIIQYIAILNSLKVYHNIGEIFKIMHDLKEIAKYHMENVLYIYHVYHTTPGKSPRRYHHASLGYSFILLISVSLAKFYN